MINNAFFVRESDDEIIIPIGFLPFLLPNLGCNLLASMSSLRIHFNLLRSAVLILFIAENALSQSAVQKRRTRRMPTIFFKIPYERGYFKSFIELILKRGK